MNSGQFQPTPEAEARLLLLIATFSHGSSVLEGRTKLAKLDFFLRYPAFLNRALNIRRAEVASSTTGENVIDLETRMVRYRYGPWDPSYYAVLGRLVGKGLVEPVPYSKGVGYKATESGHEAARKIAAEAAWVGTAERLRLLQQYFNLAGTTLKNFVYDHFPEVTKAEWGEKL